MKNILLALLTISLVACNNGKSTAETAVGDTVRLKYAEHLEIVRYHSHQSSADGKQPTADSYTVVKLSDPWNLGKTLHTYILVPADTELPADLPKGTVVRTPLRRSVVATSVHCGLINSMGREDAIRGVCDVRYINLPSVVEGVKAKRIADCGSGLQPTLEAIIDLQPDAIFLSPFQNSGGYGRVEELDIPIVETADYMETSALGRAEWMRFYGMLFGAEHETDSIFNAVEQDYLSLKQQALSSASRPSMVMDKQTGSVWYVPAGQSTVGKVIVDANIGYPWADDKQSGSLPLPFETILEKAGTVDLWLFRYNAPNDMRLADLVQDNPGYAQFKAYKNGEVYGCNTDVSRFYEDTPFHPNLLLRDFIRIAHPDLNLGAPVYFIKLQP